MNSRDDTTYFSVFDLFKIGIGPSSSHSVGPMNAAARFLKEIEGVLPSVTRVRVDLYGSLALTGIGHGTDTAVLLGLLGEEPEHVDTETVPQKLATIREQGNLLLAGTHSIAFHEEDDLLFQRSITLDAHPNGLRFQAFLDANPNPAHSATYFSIGGGFVVGEGQCAPGAPSAEAADAKDTGETTQAKIPFPFTSAAELLQMAKEHRCPISELMRANERVALDDDDIRSRLMKIWHTMQACVQRGCRTKGVLPGGLHVERRAPGLYKRLTDQSEASNDPLAALDWVDLYAIAVNEENAAGGRVVTAPTNGAAGIIPAVLHYYFNFCPGANDEHVEQFLLTAAAIGSLYKRNASISGAEVGCQGEVGVACSMAAGALTEVLGGSPNQVEQAAEIGMEHNLGLTCDPIKGLVQIPCIERNAMGAVKAINASRLALRGDGCHNVSLDRVIRVMKRTGADTSTRYKETSQGGLAVNIAEC